MIPRSRRRLFGLYVIAVAAIVVLGGRLWYLQVLDTTQYKALAQVNQTRSIVVPAVRGMITDDTGPPMVRNETEMVVSVNMLDLSQHTTDNGAGRAQAARAAAAPVGQDAQREGQALHPRRPPAVLDRVAVPAGPGGGARQRRDRAADHGGAEGCSSASPRRSSR